MTSVIFSGAFTPAMDVVHGVRKSNKPITLTPVEYISYLGSIYDKYRDHINHSISNSIALYTPSDDVNLKCDLIFDEVVPTSKEIFNRIGMMTRGKFYPNRVGIAFPLSITYYRRLGHEFEHMLGGVRSPIASDFIVESEFQAFTSKEIRSCIDYAYELKVRSSKKSEHRDTEKLYLIGVDLRPIQDTCQLTDDSLITDPHILVVHPEAVSWVKRA